MRTVSCPARTRRVVHPGPEDANRVADHASRWVGASTIPLLPGSVQQGPTTSRCRPRRRDGSFGGSWCPALNRGHRYRLEGVRTWNERAARGRPLGGRTELVAFLDLARLSPPTPPKPQLIVVPDAALRTAPRRRTRRPEGSASIIQMREAAARRIAARDVAPADSMARPVSPPGPDKATMLVHGSRIRRRARSRSGARRTACRSWP